MAPWKGGIPEMEVLILAFFLGGMGLICAFTRRTLLGLMIGIQLLVMGAAVMSVASGMMTNQRVLGNLFGYFIVLSSVIQFVTGCALAMRFFALKRKAPAPAERPAP